MVNHAQAPHVTTFHPNSLAPPHANANAHETQLPTNRKRHFLYAEQASDGEEGTGHNFCPSYNQHSTFVLWQYKREYAESLANKSGASKVVNQMFEFDNGINKITDWQKVHPK
jgi:hypothetical protein